MKKRLAIIVPCYNEEEVFDDTNKILIGIIKDLIAKKKIKSNSYILYVDDGSRDKTWEKINKSFRVNDYIKGLKLASNKGHQNALFAGLMYAKNDSEITISIDADLQDDVNAIEEMINKNNEGNDIVYGVRNDRKSDSKFKKITAELFYKIMNAFGAKTVYNSADFRLLSLDVLNELSLYSETHLFLRGIIPELGFKSDCVYYKRLPRLKGESKYPLKKMLSFAFDGIISFSDKPISIIILLGLFALIISVVSLIYSLTRYVQGDTIQGWTSLFVSIWFIGGVQLISLGVIGKYVGKTYIESKKRPRYYIEKILSKSNKK